MAKSHFSSIDIAIAIFSLFTYLIDVGTDVATGTQYFLEGKELFGWLTAGFVLLPAILTSIFSLTWHLHDKTLKPLIVLLHILPLAPVQRYARVVHLGLMSRKTQKVVHTQRALRAQNDVSILRLIEAFMESAPQLVLQLYIMVTSSEVHWLLGLTAASSLLSLSWSMTAYSDSLRKAHSSRYHHRLSRLIWHWGWQLFMTTSRIAAFVFLASIIDLWLFAVMGGHWLLAFIWISFKGTDFGNGLCEKWMFRGVCAFIYIFVFLNLNDGLSRWRITAFYVVVFIENAAMVAVYMASADGGNLMTLSCVTVFGGFVLGLVCMLVYYGFFHPSGRRVKFTMPFQSTSRMFSTSRTSNMFSPGSGVQVFSIESPTAATSIRGTNVNPIQQTRSSKVSNISSSDRTSHRLSHVSVRSGSSQKHLQKVWQSGIESSSSDSSSLSSLASDEPLTNKLENRPPSRNSNNSENSGTSDNCLLPPLTRNDLSKSSEAAPKFQFKESVLMKKNFSGEVSVSDSVNIQSNTDSPTLSRGSWARSSDYKPSQVEEFVTLPFDDSSSTDRRGSDTSSYTSRPKSMSPLDAVNLWQDAHGKLKQTIAATIAAATGTTSSNEGTPNRSRSSVSQNTTISSQDENLSSFSQNSVFLESHHSNSERNDAGVLHYGIISCGRQKEALSSLPDILEAVESDLISDISGSENNYIRMARQNKVNSKSPYQTENRRLLSLEYANTAASEMQSPYREDSTLTASKLLAEESKSYLHPSFSRQRHDVEESSPRKVKEDVTSVSSPALQGKGTESRKDTSPFTDQELVSVMAKSLQSYMGYSTPTASSTSIELEREGLALAIEDLQFSPESTMVKTRSSSSLFHDSDNSSPVSSASKLQRQVEAKKGCEELSPDALKVLADFPSHLKDTLDIHGIPNSQALNILREAYAHSLAATPHARTNSPKIHSSQSSRPGRNRDDRTGATSNRITEGKNIECPDQNRPPKHDRSSSFVQQESEKYDENTPCRLKGDKVLLDSVALQKSKLMANRANGHVRAGKSNTKKLSVHSTSFQLENYSSSPCRPGQTLEVSAADKHSEEYVKGKYRPPLCEVQENINLRNFDQYQRTSPDTDSKREQIEALTKTGDQRSKRLSLYNEDEIEFLRKEIMRHDRRRSHQESDFFNLHVRDSDKSPRKKYSSVSQPNLKSSRPVSPRRKAMPVLEGGRRDERRLDDSPHHSHRRTHARSPHHPYNFDRKKGYDSATDQELENSASHVVDYFSQALDSRNRRFSHNPALRQKRSKHFSQPDLQIHGSRSHQDSSDV